MTDYDTHTLRQTFEEWTAKKWGWDNFRRDEKGYRSHQVQSAWYWLCLGFATGQKFPKEPTEVSDNQTDALTPHQQCMLDMVDERIRRLEEDLAYQKGLAESRLSMYHRLLEKIYPEQGATL